MTSETDKTGSKDGAAEKQKKSKKYYRRRCHELAFKLTVAELLVKTTAKRIDQLEADAVNSGKKTSKVVSLGDDEITVEDCTDDDGKLDIASLLSKLSEQAAAKAISRLPNSCRRLWQKEEGRGSEGNHKDIAVLISVGRVSLCLLRVHFIEQDSVLGVMAEAVDGDSLDEQVKRLSENGYKELTLPEDELRH